MGDTGVPVTHVRPQQLEQGRHGLEAVDEPRLALRGEEGGRDAHVRAHVEHHVSLADVDAVLQVRALGHDLRELEPELRSVVVAQKPAESVDAGLGLAVSH